MVTTETWKGLGSSTPQAGFQVGLCTVTGACWWLGDQGINKKRGIQAEKQGPWEGRYDRDCCKSTLSPFGDLCELKFESPGTVVQCD